VFFLVIFVALTWRSWQDVLVMRWKRGLAGRKAP